MNNLKWGFDVKHDDIFGQNSVAKIAITQFLIVVCTLTVLKPKFLCTKSRSDIETSQLHLIRIILIALLLVASTYYYPLLNNN
jgi:hypothetical protein